MRGLFSMDTPVMRFLEKVMNLIILNICFLFSCIPVITIGTALTAMYSVNLRMVKGEESYILKSYWKAFGRNFKQSTCVWLIAIVMGVIFFLDIRVASVMNGTFGFALKVLIGTFGICYAIVSTYIYPYIGWFEDKVLVCLKNAFFMGVGSLGHTFVILLIPATIVAVMIMDLELLLKTSFLWLTIGFALVNYVQCYFLRMVFSKYSK